MNAILVAGPAVEPVSLADAKAHLRLDGSDEDDLVSELVAAARQAVEATTRRCLVQQTWRIVRDTWPAGRSVAIPLAPVLSVGAVRVSTAAGSPATLASGLYRLDRSADPVRLVLDGAAPDPGIPAGGIEVDLLCGYGPGASDVPAPLRLAIRRLVARWFTDRGDGPIPAPPPGDVRALILPYLRPRVA